MSASATRLFLVRHGATQLTAEDRFSGSVGVDLSDEGRRQAAFLADRLAHERIAAVYASPLARTLETARIVARPHQPDARRARRPARDQPRPLGGADRARRSRPASPTSTRPGSPTRSRSRPRPASRASRCWRARCPSCATSSSATRARTSLVVSHKATLRLLLSSLLGFDARGYRDRLDQSPACLNVVDFKDPVRARLMLFNDISHYQDQPRRAEGNLSKWWDADAGGRR